MADRDPEDPGLRAEMEEKLRAWLAPEKWADSATALDWIHNLHGAVTFHSFSMNPTPRVTFAYTVQPDHCNRLGNLHGGCAATLFDLCTTVPLALVNRPGFWSWMGVSRTLNVTYLRPVARGEQVLIEGEVVQAGRQLCTLAGRIRRRSDGQVMAVCEHGKFNIDPPAGKL